MKPINLILSIVSVLFYSSTVFAVGLPNHAFNVRGIKIDYQLSNQQQTSTINAADRVNITTEALNLAGTQYHYGGNLPETGFDCSGFVQYVYKQAANINLPRNAKAIGQSGTRISRAALQDGDLVFFNINQKTDAHVGIYIGQDRMIHAPSTGKSVSITKLDNAYWKSHFNGGLRVMKP